CLVLAAAHFTTGCTGMLDERDEMGRGFGVLTSLLTANGTKVRRRLREVSQVDEEVAAIVVIGPESKEVTESLLDWVSDGGHLFCPYPGPLMLEKGRLKPVEASCPEKLDLDSKVRLSGMRLFAPT